MKTRWTHILFVLTLALCAMDTLRTHAAQNDPAIAKPKQKTFASPDDLATAYVTACEQQDTAAMRALLGPGGEELINSGDEAQDKRRRERFANMAKEAMQVRPDPYNLDRFLIYVGERQWPLPIPIVKDGNAYRFDTGAARTEILARRVGHNELDAIALLREILAAQIDFAYADQKEVGIREYAQNIISDPDKHNGLYWDANEGDPASPLADAINKAVAQGYELPQAGEPFLYHGYIFKMLLAQGPNAPGGARDYVLQDKMMGGFAAVAYPVEYGVTGIKTFLVNQDGTVQEKDLGASSSKMAENIKAYNPDKTWNEAPREETESETKAASKP